jgi:hypothetical protein
VKAQLRIILAKSSVANLLWLKGGRLSGSGGWRPTGRRSVRWELGVVRWALGVGCWVLGVGCWARRWSLVVRGSDGSRPSGVRHVCCCVAIHHSQITIFVLPSWFGRSPAEWRSPRLLLRCHSPFTNHNFRSAFVARTVSGRVAFATFVVALPFTIHKSQFSFCLRGPDGPRPSGVRHVCCCITIHHSQITIFVLPSWSGRSPAEKVRRWAALF